jgi:nucleoid-associated protein YgaU
MSKSRYKNRRKIFNASEVTKSRQAQGASIKHYTTPKLVYPSDKTKKSLIEVEHIWSHGDKYWKLAANYYNDPGYWWVIAWYNLKPTDAHCNIGDAIMIPKPLSKILKYYGH